MTISARRFFARFALFAFLLPACAAVHAGPARQAPPQVWSDVVSHVSDGDTLWVRPDEANQRPRKLRLYGIDAPESCQVGGPQARQALIALAHGQRVRVRSLARDRWGRSVVVLEVNGRDAAAQLVAQGWAWSYGRHRRDAGPYAAEQAAAQRARRGLFADPAPQRPADFRRQHGPCPLPAARPR